MHNKHLPFYISQVHHDLYYTYTLIHIWNDTCVTPLPWCMLNIFRDTYYAYTLMHVTYVPQYILHINRDTCYTYTVIHITHYRDTCFTYNLIPVAHTPWCMLHIHQGRIQEFWLGGRGFFFKGMAFGARLKAPQWVQGNALVGSQGVKPPEAPEF